MVANLPLNSLQQHQAFLASSQKHILMITNHGIHQWQIIPGLPDTGGQNVSIVPDITPS
jgi:transcriptional regulator